MSDGDGKTHVAWALLPEFGRVDDGAEFLVRNKLNSNARLNQSKNTADGQECPLYYSFQSNVMK